MDIQLVSLMTAFNSMLLEFALAFAQELDPCGVHMENAALLDLSGMAHELASCAGDGRQY